MLFDFLSTFSIFIHSRRRIIQLPCWIWKCKCIFYRIYYKLQGGFSFSMRRQFGIITEAKSIFSSNSHAPQRQTSAFCDSASCNFTSWWCLHVSFPLPPFLGIKSGNKNHQTPLLQNRSKLQFDRTTSISMFEQKTKKYVVTDVKRWNPRLSKGEVCVNIQKTENIYVWTSSKVMNKGKETLKQIKVVDSHVCMLHLCTYKYPVDHRSISKPNKNTLNKVLVVNGRRTE